MNDADSQESRAGSPLVSVIIPAYKAAGHIVSAIESVLAQTFSDHEIIVINDGSPDTSQLLEVLSPYRDRIRYLEQPNQGPSGARNTGIRAARGTYVAFLDSDDSWSPSYLGEQIRLLAVPQLVTWFIPTLSGLGRWRDAGRPAWTRRPAMGP